MNRHWFQEMVEKHPESFKVDDGDRVRISNGGQCEECVPEPA